jgi:Rieske Fe-S protein
LSDEENERFTEKLATTYGMKIPRESIASALTSRPKLPVLLSRASFRADADVRTVKRTRPQNERRNFLRAIFGFAVVSIAALIFQDIISWSKPQLQPTTTPPNTNPSNSANTNVPTIINPPGPAAQSIANAANLTPNRSTIYNDPALGPIIVIHLDNGKFVAYSSICTHAGCQVKFDPSGKDIVCPCHGAVYDPYHNAQVIGGPAPYPLPNVPIKYDTATGNIYLNG